MRPLPSASATLIVHRLARLPQVEDLSWLALRLVMAVRVLALCGPAGRDPLLELTTRLRSVPQARALIALADAVGRAWPENVAVQRPCCRALSPDEATLALMVEAARGADRTRFAQALAGLVRPDRHEPLFDLTVEAVATMAVAGWGKD